MPNGMNRVFLCGNVSKDPKYRTFDQGAILEVRLVSNEGYKDKDDQWKEHTEYHNVVIKGNRATGLSKHIKKGTGLIIVGKLRTRSWDDKEQEGKRQFITEVHAIEVHFAGGPRDGGGGDDDRDDHDGGSSSGGSRGGSRGSSRSSSRSRQSSRRDDEGSSGHSNGDHADHGGGDFSDDHVTGGADKYGDDDIPF